MAHALSTHLAAIRPHLHPGLVTPDAAARFDALPDHLPPFRHAILEIRLGPHQGPVDLSWKYAQDDLRVLDGNAPGECVRRLARFSKQWSDGTSRLARDVYQIGLEFDLDRTPTADTLPSIFFCFMCRDTAATLDAIAEIGMLVGRPLTPGLRSALKRAADPLPAGAEINYLGLMLPRADPGARIGIERLAPDVVVSYLHAIGWTGRGDALAAFLSTVDADLARGRPVLAIDADERGVSPRVGLEYILAHEAAVTSDRPRRLLDHLVSLGLCTPGQRDAVLAWPSAETMTEAPGWIDHFLARPANGTFIRTLSHVKLVTDATTALSAKAYLEASYF